ncbi:hypothetical protein GCM10010176_034070 [Nonomuraea spiralis]|nr:hypothetical protein GCM10010176_034070 [Nonomuraea spiralis]
MPRACRVAAGVGVGASVLVLLPLSGARLTLASDGGGLSGGLPVLSVGGGAGALLLFGAAAWAATRRRAGTPRRERPPTIAC